MITKDNARPIGFVCCVVTLCTMALLEATGVGSAPTWAIGTFGAYVGEYLLERGIRKAVGKGGK